MARRTKILVYCCHHRTLGHARRLQTLCDTLTRRMNPAPEIFLLESDTPPVSTAFPKKNFRLTIPKADPTTRSEFILTTARALQPDILITEFFPLGRIELLPELFETLRYLHRKGTLIYASTGYPYLVDLPRLRSKVFNATVLPLIRLYQRIFIHTPENFENSFFSNTFDTPGLRTCYDSFFAAIRQKTSYTGYIPPPKTPFPSEIKKILSTDASRHTIVVSRGGGTFFPKIITCSIQAQNILGDNYRFIIAAGPSTPQSDAALFEALRRKYANKQIFLFNHIPGLARLFNDCDLSVSTCGYNTSMELLASGIPHIIIPNPNNDQQARAALLCRHFKSTVLPYHRITPDSLAEHIKRLCRKKNPRNSMPKNFFRGHIITTRLIMSDLAKKHSAR